MGDLARVLQFALIRGLSIAYVFGVVGFGLGILVGYALSLIIRKFKS